MKRLVFVTALAALALAAFPMRGAADAAADPMTYEDPAMRFTAPAGYERAPIALPSAFNPGEPGGPTNVATFIKNRASKTDYRIITVVLEPFDGTLDGFEATSENNLRGSVDSVFFSKKERSGLKNGMPAYWLSISIGSGFDTLHRYAYEWIDTVRGVTLSITARDISEKEAKEALAEASATAYPRGRE